MDPNRTSPDPPIEEVDRPNPRKGRKSLITAAELDSILGTLSTGKAVRIMMNGRNPALYTYAVRNLGTRHKVSAHVHQDLPSSLTIWLTTRGDTP